MDEFNDDEFNEDEFNEFKRSNDFSKHFREMEKEMLKIDLSRGGVMPMSIKDFSELFGEPTEEDMFDITQAYMKQYHTHGDEYVPVIIDAYGKEWVEFLLKYNEGVEEYELCSIIKDHLDEYALVK